ncbi:MAG: hypothetical protein K2Y16_13355 [Burkholderiales bacterium]|nr:hypothetical protein [Burkholderiales bacterium]
MLALELVADGDRGGLGRRSCLGTPEIRCTAGTMQNGMDVNTGAFIVPDMSMQKRRDTLQYRQNGREQKAEQRRCGSGQIRVRQFDNDAKATATVYYNGSSGNLTYLNQRHVEPCNAVTVSGAQSPYGRNCLCILLIFNVF